MKISKYYENLSQIPIFRGIDKEKLPDYLLHLRAYVKDFKKGDYIYIEGDRNIKLCVILYGKVELIRNDYWGNDFLIAKLKEYDVFGETFAFMKDAPIDLDVMASEDSLILQINFSMVNNKDKMWVEENNILKENMLSIFAMKNYYLSRKLKIVSQRRIREKLIEFLQQRKLETGKNKFNIGMSKKQLADYLCVDRSALSTEMKKMKEEKLIDFDKKLFKLNENNEAYK